MNGIKNTQLKTHLKDVPLFSNMNDDQLAVLAQIGAIKRFAKGQIIVNQSSPGNTFYIVISGHVKVALLHEDGREIALSHLSDGNFFGELSLLDNDTQVRKRNRGRRRHTLYAFPQTILSTDNR